MRKALDFLAVFLTAIAAALTLAATPTLAQTITNTASIQWTVDTSTVIQQSNRVDLTIDQLPGVTVATYQFTSNANALQLSVTSTTCRGTGGDANFQLEGAFAGQSLNPAAVERTSQIRAGEPLFLTIESPADNLDPNAVNTIQVAVSTPGGDRETLVFRETGNSTGRFAAVVRTSAVPPTAIQGDCALSLLPGDSIILDTKRNDGSAIGNARIDVLVDPYGIVFDSANGTPIAGTRVTLVDADTSQPASVYGDDAISRFPSTVVTGSTVTDAAGAQYIFPEGDYRFPFVAPGRYRLLVEPPSPYTAPSLATPPDLAPLRRPDGQPFTIGDGSYGAVFALTSPQPVRIDIPADRVGGALSLRKIASVAVAVPGDAVQYRLLVANGATFATGAITITDRLPEAMRLRPDSVRYNGVLLAYIVTKDGRTLTISLPALAASGSGTLTYLLEVRPDAQSGDTTNRARARDSRGTESAVADAMVRIARDGLSDRMTIIGRITQGGCAVDPARAKGIANVRVMIEDGSYAVTDIDGRYHFEGVVPGTHVVQFDSSTLGADLVPTDCTANARSSGSAISRFVEGQGGSLVRADFRAQPGTNAAASVLAAVRAAPVADGQAAGADRDWLTGQFPGVAWLFPEPDHNPRIKAIRVAIKHLPGQRVALFVDGKPVNPLALDGTRNNVDDSVAITTWRALDVDEGDTHFTAQVRDANGAIVERLSRSVHYSGSALNATFVRDRSVLVADGVTRPVIAVHLTDRDGRPVRNGVVGDFTLPSPYLPAVEADAQAARQLAGLERAKPVWRVEGDDGIAYIELEPTTASGALQITLPFRDREVTRLQRIDAWLEPGNRPWTVVGFAEGTVGFNTLKGRLEGLGPNGEKWLTDGRVALYAKGKVQGKWLLTLAYDSDKRQEETRFGGTIDPQAYYTIYADRSERRYDAASVRKLYVRLERPQFYALFGDYDTGMAEPQLTRYVRAFNGVKAQYQGENVGVTAFAADTPYRHRREEIQGTGLSGPYALAARDLLPNSERVTIEVRDRLRSDRIVSSTVLVRHIDYDIDYIAGTLRFSTPILSRSSDLDPQIIIADYEVDGVAQRVVNAGGRATWRNTAKTLTLGASAIHDETDLARTNIGGVDLRYIPNASTEVRAEFAASDASSKSAGLTSGGTSTAWLVEAEHHGPKYDLLAYARQQERGFGVGQLNASETGTRKFGADGRLRVTDTLSLVGSAWLENYLNSDAKRTAGSARLEYPTKAMDLRAGIQLTRDTLADGREAQSSIVQLGATRRFLDNRLELDAQTEFALGGQSESIDFPGRHRATARFAVTKDVTAVASYEIARGKTIDANTARIGFDIKPWAGGRLTSSVNRQDIAEYGPRSFAAYGLAQSLPLGKRWSVDLTLDGNKTLGGLDPARVLNPAHPVASGGFIGGDGTLTEDFTAVTAGATYRADRWSWTGRVEARSGSRTDRWGVITSALRSLGEGRALGGTFSYFRAKADAGTRTTAANLAISWANRPDTSRVAWLEKLELRSDTISGAVLGQPGPIGGAPLLVSGDAATKRIVNSLSVNWSPVTRAQGRYLGRSEVGLFWGSRYVSDRFDGEDLKGWSNIVGADLRFDLSQTLDFGVAGTVRESAGGKAYSFSGGPSLGISPFKGGYVSLGYNMVGFHDRDYADARYTRSGPYVTLRFKFDQTTLQGLGLAR